MSGEDIALILQRLDQQDDRFDRIEEKVDHVVEKVAAREQREHDSEVRWQGRADLFRWGVTLWKSDMVKWLMVAAGVLMAKFS